MLGQTPNLNTLRSQMFKQLTGQELSNELSEPEKNEAITTAMQGNNLLLVLDDVWDESAPNSFIFLCAAAFLTPRHTPGCIWRDRH